jgi:hypothetical protein
VAESPFTTPLGSMVTSRAWEKPAVPAVSVPPTVRSAQPRSSEPVPRSNEEPEPTVTFAPEATDAVTRVTNTAAAVRVMNRDVIGFPPL